MTASLPPEPPGTAMTEVVVDEITEVPDAVQGAMGNGQFSSWDIGADLAGYLAEAAVADLLFKDDARTVWRGGNHRGVDVYADFPDSVSDADTFKKAGQELARTKVDVKHAYRNEYLFGGEKQSAVSFFGASREIQVREGVSHYALVVFDLDPELIRPNRVEVTDGLEARVVASYRLERLYFIPADDVNRIFRQRENKAGELTGLEQCAPLTEIRQYLVAGTVLENERNGDDGA